MKNTFQIEDVVKLTRAELIREIVDLLDVAVAQSERQSSQAKEERDRYFYDGKVVCAYTLRRKLLTMG